MDSEYFQFEELVVPEAIGLPFHGLDFGVGALQRASRDSVVVIGENALAVLVHGAGELLQHRYPRRLGTANPVPENQASRWLVPLLPDLPKILLQIIGQGQWRIQAQGVLQALAFVAAGIEVLGILEQQPTRPLEKLAL